MAYSRDYPNSIIPKGSKVVECLQNDDKELKRILGILSDIGVMSLFGSKRQCVLHAATGTDGKPSYLTANGLNVAINGSTTPVIVTFAGGYNANGTVDKTDTIVDTVNAWTMPANGTYYLYIDKDMSTGILSYGYTTIPDTYATTAPASPVLDQCYFNTVDMKMYHYNSSAWEQKLRVFVAKAVTTADTATLTIYPFTSRTTASNFIQYDGNGNLQAVDLAGALTQLSASKFIGTFKGDIVGNADTATKALAADKCTGNADTATKATNDKNGADIANTYFPKSGGTISGDITAHNFNGTLHGTADNATHAGTADNATYAGTADNATHAGTADNATYAGTADNASQLSGYSLNTGQSGDWGLVPFVRPGDGVMEIGKYIDWHATNYGNVDYTSRFTAEENGTVTVGTINGSLNGTLHGTADNADQLNGYTAAQLISKVAGRNQPTLTSILDGCYDGNGNKFNKVVNAGTGISGYDTGDIHLTQSYKNFDKILVVQTNVGADYEIYTLWDTWQLAYAFSHGSRFGVTNGASDAGHWNVCTSVKAGTSAHKLSTDTIWYLSDENSTLVDIIGVNY